MRKSLLGSTAVAMICIAIPAFAEDVPDSGAVTDIIVTAQRKSENMQKAAIAIDAVTGDSLIKSGISSAVEITKSVPSLTVTNVGGSVTSLYLRGVGNRTSSSWADPAIATSYDGVYLGRSAGAFGTAFYDLARVEVLKGPQGILYGRNATGGAINIIPARPELGRLGAGVNLGAGDYGAISVQGHVNVPIGDNVALRVAGAHQEHDGYNRDGTNDQDTTGFRAQLLYEPSSDLSIRVGGDYTKLRGLGAGNTYLGNYTPGPTGYDFAAAPLDINEGLNTDAANAYRTTLLGAPGFGFLTPINAKPYINYTYWGLNSEISLRTGIGTLTILPAYRESKGSSLFSGPAFNTAFTDETDRQFTLEGRLAGARGSLDYIIGGYYFHETIDSQNEYNQEFVLPIQVYRQKTESWAAFGQLTAHVSDRFRLVGGARYTHDSKDMNGLINNFITFCGGLPPALLTPPASFGAGCAAPNGLPRYPNFLTTGDTVNWLVANGWIAPGTTDTATPQVFPLLNGVGAILKTYNPVIDRGTYSRLTWKASAEFDITPQSLLYATAETGYRAGGFQLAEGRPRYNPEFLDAYTIGSKNRFFGNRLQLNVEAFLWKYRDQQITYFTADPNGVLISSTENAGRVTIKGFDVDAIVKPTSTTTLSAKVQYLSATYDNLHLFTAAPRDNFNCPFTLTGAIAGGAPVKDFNCSGRQAVYSPEWTVNLGAEQIVPISDKFELVGNVSTAWRDKQFGGFEYLDFELIPAYWTTDLSLSLRSVSSKWSLTAYVLNLEDRRRSLAPQLAPTGQAVSVFGPPRTYGVRFSADF